MEYWIEIPLGPVGRAVFPLSTWVTWGILLELALVCVFLRRRLSVDRPGPLQNVFELFTESLCSLIREIVRTDPRPYVPLVGTLFLFVFVSNLFGMIPGLSSPTADVSVTAGLSLVVFLSVPFYGIRAKGWRGYLRNYVKPNPFLLPLNLLGELTRTLSLAVRLFGNIMSGELLLAVVIGVVTSLLKGYAAVFIPFAFPLTLFLAVLSLITAAIQAYIFTVLALVYIGSAVERADVPQTSRTPRAEEGTT